MQRKSTPFRCFTSTPFPNRTPPWASLRRSDMDWLAIGMGSGCCWQDPPISFSLSSPVSPNMGVSYCGLKTRLCQGCVGNFPISFGAPLTTALGLLSVHPSSWPAGPNMEVWTLSPHPGQTVLTPNDKKATILSSHNRSSTVVSACQFLLSTMLSVPTTAR